MVKNQINYINTGIRTIEDLRNRLAAVEASSIPLVLIKHPDRDIWQGLKARKKWEKRLKIIHRRLPFKANTKEYKKMYHQLTRFKKSLGERKNKIRNLGINLKESQRTKEQYKLYRKLYDKLPDVSVRIKKYRTERYRLYKR